MIKQSVLIPLLFPFTFTKVDWIIKDPNHVANVTPYLESIRTGIRNTDPPIVTALPIILQDFRTVFNTDGRAKLEWRLSAIDEDIEIRLLNSTNNITWNVILTITEPVSGSIKNYEYYPNCQGNNFYKLQIITKSSISIDSKILPLTCSAVAGNAYPNPAKGYIMMEISGNEWRVHSADGRRWNVPGQLMGNGFVQLDLRNLPLGYYIIITAGKRTPILHI